MSKNIFFEQIGRRIRDIRKKKKLTQEELAWKVNKSLNFIGQRERGTKKPSIQTLKKIADALEVPIGSFFEDIEYNPPEEDVMIKKINLLLKEASPEEKKVVYQIVKAIFRKKSS